MCLLEKQQAACGKASTLSNLAAIQKAACSRCEGLESVFACCECALGSAFGVLMASMLKCSNTHFRVRSKDLARVQEPSRAQRSCKGSGSSVEC